MTTSATETPLPPAEAAALEAQRAGFLRGGAPWYALRALSRSRIGMVGLALVVFWIAVAALAPLLAPHDPFALQADQLNQPPSAT